MKKLIAILALAVGLVAACSPAATPSLSVPTEAPSLPGASESPLGSTGTSPLGSGAGSSLAPGASPSM